MRAKIPVHELEVDTETGTIQIHGSYRNLLMEVKFPQGEAFSRAMICNFTCIKIEIQEFVGIMYIDRNAIITEEERGGELNGLPK